MLALLQTMRRAVPAVILITLAALAVTRTGGGPVAAQPSAAGAALPTNPVADPQAAGVQWFAPTGHTLRGTFLAYWNAHGALAQFGYPITEEFQELSPLDHQPYTVQYFERSRFEHHPEHAGTPYEVELGLLGLAIAQQQGYFPLAGATACGTILMRGNTAPTDAAALAVETCLWQAYQQCHPATMEVTMMGVDSGVTHTFTVVPGGGQCRVTDVAEAYVVPLRSHVTRTYTCSGVAQPGDGLHFTGCGDEGEIIVPRPVPQP